jgi:hypothetical protein
MDKADISMSGTTVEVEVEVEVVVLDLAAMVVHPIGNY